MKNVANSMLIMLTVWHSLWLIVATNCYKICYIYENGTYWLLLWHFEPARLNPIKLVASSSMGTFNWQGQSANSLCNRAYYYTELAISSLATVTTIW